MHKRDFGISFDISFGTSLKFMFMAGRFEVSFNEFASKFNFFVFAFDVFETKLALLLFYLFKGALLFNKIVFEFLFDSDIILI